MLYIFIPKLRKTNIFCFEQLKLIFSCLTDVRVIYFILKIAGYYYLGTNYLTMILGPATLSMATYLVRTMSCRLNVTMSYYLDPLATCSLEAPTHVQSYPEFWHSRIIRLLFFRRRLQSNSGPVRVQSWLRVSRRLHTANQVMAGAALGSAFGALWFALWRSLVQEALLTSSLSARIAVILGSAVSCVGIVVYMRGRILHRGGRGSIPSYCC